MLIELTATKSGNWSTVCDSIGHEKPQFINETGERMWLSDLKTMIEILHIYEFSALRFSEDDGSITLSLNEIDIVENGKDEEEARLKLGNSILEYSLDYYNEYEMYSHSTNRKKHMPYIFKALIIQNPRNIGDMVKCQNGKD